jgi:hypothetical protein
MKLEFSKLSITHSMELASHSGPHAFWPVESSNGRLGARHHSKESVMFGLVLLPATTGRGQLKCDGTRAEIRFRLSAKLTSPFKSAGASVQSTTGSRGVRISGSNAGYTMFRGSVKGTGYPLHSPVSPSLPPLASSCALTFQLESAPLAAFSHHSVTVIFSRSRPTV